MPLHRYVTRAAAWALAVIAAVTIITALAIGRAHPIWDAVCITGQILEADGTHTTFPTTCDTDH